MSKRDDERLLKLAQKNAAKPAPTKPAAPKYDSTLQRKPEEDNELRTFFNDMKKREF